MSLPDHLPKPVFLLIILFLFVSPVEAKLIETEGAALIEKGAKGKAREEAIKQAIRQAQLQTLALVDSASMVVGNSLVVDSARVSAAGLVKDVVVIEEWQQEGLYHVRIRAQVVEEKLRLPSNAARYRKKISVTQFEVEDRRQIFDLPMIEVKLARELQRRLENTGLVLARDGADYRLSEQDQHLLDGKKASYQEVVTRLATQLSSQFVVTGSIIDMGVHTGWIRDTRHIVLDVAVYDGISGTLISKHRVNERIIGAGYLDSSMVFGSVEFLVDDYGAVLDQVLDRLASRIIVDLSILPFSAKVLHVAGRDITLDAGATSLMSVGDTLMAYQLENSVTYDGNGRYLGIKESPMVTVTIKTVQPQFSVAELESDEITIKPGDLVRFGW